MIKLDTKDRKILSILDMDARLPLSVIAKKVGLSREVVHYRIKQLEKKGVIEGYYTAIDVSKLGLLYCRIFLKYRQMSQEKEQELLEYSKESDAVVWVAVGDGRWDLTLILLAKNLGVIESVYDELSSKFGKYFQNTYVSIAFRIYHFKHNCIYGTNDLKQEILGDTPKEKIKLDETDHSILKIISDDARISLLDISQKLKITPKLVSYRINKLIKEKIIISFRAKINTRQLGFDHYKVFLILENMGEENQKKLYAYLRCHPNVIYITKSMGLHNLEFEIIVKNASELHEHMREFSYNFSDTVVNYDTLLCYSEPILKYIPF